MTAESCAGSVVESKMAASASVSSGIDAEYIGKLVKIVKETLAVSMLMYHK